MTPIKFTEQNVVFAENQPEYQPLHAFLDKGQLGQQITCWQLSDEEIEVIVKEKKLWVSQMTFHKPAMPLLFSVNKSDVLITKPLDEESHEHKINSFVVITKWGDTYRLSINTTNQEIIDIESYSVIISHRRNCLSAIKNEYFDIHGKLREKYWNLPLVNYSKSNKILCQKCSNEVESYYTDFYLREGKCNKCRYEN